MARSKKPQPPPGASDLRLVFVPLSEVLRWEQNPKRHDIGAIITSIVKHGFREPPVFDANLNGGKGGIASGNGRSEALMEMFKSKYALPRNIALIEATGEWAMPVIMGGDAESERMARAFAIDANNLVLSGGDYSGIDIARLWDQQGYADLLADLAQHETLPVSVDGEDVDDLIGRLARAGAPAAGTGGGYDSFEQTQHIVKVGKGADAKPTFGVLVLCDGEGEQAEMFERLKDEGYNVVLQGTKPPGVKR